MRRKRLLVGLVGVVAALILVGLGYLLGDQSSGSSGGEEAKITPSPTLPSFAGSADLTAYKAAVQRVIEEGFNQGNADVLGEIYSPDYVGHLPPSEKDRVSLTFDDYKEVFILLHASVPDLHVSGEIMIAEGNMVAVRAVLQGTFEGEFYDIPPTGQALNLAFTVIQRFNDEGKIAEEWIEYDTRALAEQFGMGADGGN